MFRHTIGIDPADIDHMGHVNNSVYLRWVQDAVDLSAYAGRKVLLRFEYVTDDATSLTGMAVDNIEDPELGFRDWAASEAGWTNEGFKRIERPMAQQFIVQVIRGETVERVALDAANLGSVRLDGSETIAISCATEGTAEVAPYTWSLGPSAAQCS